MVTRALLSRAIIGPKKKNYCGNTKKKNWHALTVFKISQTHNCFINIKDNLLVSPKVKLNITMIVLGASWKVINKIK